MYDVTVYFADSTTPVLECKNIVKVVYGKGFCNYDRTDMDILTYGFEVDKPISFVTDDDKRYMIYPSRVLAIKFDRKD